MIRHVLTLMWNRRRANALLILEIFLAYVVLFAVGTIGTSLWANYRQPLAPAPFALAPHAFRTRQIGRRTRRRY